MEDFGGFANLVSSQEEASEPESAEVKLHLRERHKKRAKKNREAHSSLSEQYVPKPKIKKVRGPKPAKPMDRSQNIEAKKKEYEEYKQEVTC